MDATAQNLCVIFSPLPWTATPLDLTLNTQRIQTTTDVCRCSTTRIHHTRTQTEQKNSSRFLVALEKLGLHDWTSAKKKTTQSSLVLADRNAGNAKKWFLVYWARMRLGRETYQDKQRYSTGQTAMIQRIPATTAQAPTHTNTHTQYRYRHRKLTQAWAQDTDKSKSISTNWCGLWQKTRKQSFGNETRNLVPFSRPETIQLIRRNPRTTEMERSECDDVNHLLCVVSTERLSMCVCVLVCECLMVFTTLVKCALGLPLLDCVLYHICVCAVQRARFDLYGHAFKTDLKLAIEPLCVCNVESIKHARIQFTEPE